jgi:hypothetical protein
MWAQAYKHSWGFSKGMDGSPIILDQCEGGLGCPSATKMWIREALDTLDQCISLMEKFLGSLGIIFCSSALLMDVSL